MADVFVSYASDDRPTAQRLAEHLIAQGWSVWWDRDLTPGLEFAKEIEEVLRNARCVVVIWSRHSTESQWVQDEAREGLARGILVPVRIDESQIPLGLRGVQTADLSDWRGESDHGQLLRFEAAISALMEARPRSPHGDVASSVASGSGGLVHSRAARWAALAVVVLAAGIGTLVVLSNDGDEDARSTSPSGVPETTPATSTAATDVPETTSAPSVDIGSTRSSATDVPELTSAPSTDDIGSTSPSTGVPATSPAILGLGCPGSAEAGHTVRCTPALSETDASTTYGWTAAGGAPSSSEGREFSTSFSSAGTKTVDFRVCNGSACSERSATIEVSLPAPVIDSLGCSSTAEAEALVRCSPAVSNTFGTTVYEWTAPDGSPSAGSASTFETSFSSPGTGTIGLSACNGSKCHNMSASVSVSPGPSRWGTTDWYSIANSHQQGAWCPEGSFLVAFDIDEVSSWDAQDSPRMSRALCATLVWASSSAWQESFWVTVGALNSHNQLDDWCPEGMYVVGLDQDREDDAGTLGDGDAPIVGSALCARPSGSPYTSSEASWRTVGFTESMTPSGPWCPEGTFMTRIDLDGGADGRSYPIVGSVECGRPAQ
jgi:hypothetical protein